MVLSDTWFPFSLVIDLLLWNSVTFMRSPRAAVLLKFVSSVPLVRKESRPFLATDTSPRKLSTAANLRRASVIRVDRLMRLAANLSRPQETHRDHQVRAWRCIARSSLRFLEFHPAATETLRHSQPHQSRIGLRLRRGPTIELSPRVIQAGRCSQRWLAQERPHLEIDVSAETPRLTVCQTPAPNGRQAYSLPRPKFVDRGLLARRAQNHPNNRAPANPAS